MTKSGKHNVFWLVTLFTLSTFSQLYAPYVLFWNSRFIKGEVTGIYWLLPSPWIGLVLALLNLLALLVVFILYKSSVIKRVLVVFSVVNFIFFSGFTLDEFFNGYYHQDSISIYGVNYQLAYHERYSVWPDAGQFSEFYLFKCGSFGTICERTAYIEGGDSPLASANNYNPPAYRFNANINTKTLSIDTNGKTLWRCDTSIKDDTSRFQKYIGYSVSDPLPPC